jgi:hypothetical protein
MARGICEPAGSASRARGRLPNEALQRTALRAAAERPDVRQTSLPWGMGKPLT